MFIYLPCKGMSVSICSTPSPLLFPAVPSIGAQVSSAASGFERLSGAVVCSVGEGWRWTGASFRPVPTGWGPVEINGPDRSDADGRMVCRWSFLNKTWTGRLMTRLGGQTKLDWCSLRRGWNRLGNIKYLAGEVLLDTGGSP